MKHILVSIFEKLNERIEAENNDRRESGVRLIPRSKIEILGQTSLLVQPNLTYGLSLAQTGDLDALLSAENFVKKELKKILPQYGFIYDEAVKAPAKNNQLIRQAIASGQFPHLVDRIIDEGGDLNLFS